jgi:hypothetical protein
VSDRTENIPGLARSWYSRVVPTVAGTTGERARVDCWWTAIAKAGSIPGLFLSQTFPL